MMLFIVMLALLVLGVPIAAAMGISSLGYVLANGMNPIVVVQRVFSGIDQSAYLAIPFFVLAGEIMNQGGIARRIVAMVQRLVGNVTGGFGVVAIISSYSLAPSRFRYRLRRRDRRPHVRGCCAVATDAAFPPP